MQRSTRKFGFVGLVTVLLAWGPVALAAPPAQPSVPDATGPAAVQEVAVGEASVGPAVDGSTCRDRVGGLETALELPMDKPLQAGAPCCATLCDATCGVGEPCLCKRCVVLGCGV